MIPGFEAVHATQHTPRELAEVAAQNPRGLRLSGRIWMLLAAMAGECLALAQLPHPWLPLRQAMAAPIVFVAMLLFFGRGKVQAVSKPVGPVSLRYLTVHVVALGVVAVSVAVLVRPVFYPGAGLVKEAAIAVWALALVAVFWSLVMIFVPRAGVVRVARELGAGWIYAGAMTVVAMSARELARIVWDAPGSSIGWVLQRATFHGVHAVLGWFYAPVLSDPVRVIIGTKKFQVLVAGTCSGIEGLALMLALACGWLYFARRELRWQRAVWLVPVALSTMWVLNLIRIALLIAIGDAGHVDLALNGFHSEAGWIFFNAVAIGFLIAAQNMAWLRKGKAAVKAPGASSERLLAEAYLMPFLATTAATLLTRALSSGSEVLYPVRLAVGLVALYWFRRSYRTVDWRFGWVGVTAGAAVFAVWVGVAHWVASPVSAADSLPAGLALLAPWERGLWVAARLVAAALVVPVVEELAFRGYVARRVVSAEVATTLYARLGAAAIAVSSVSFGLMSGRMFVAGVGAGVMFAVVAKMKNRLGEAVAAHVTASLLMTVWVLWRGKHLL